MPLVNPVDGQLVKEYDIEQTNEINAIDTKLSQTFTKTRILQGSVTGDNTTVTFPVDWENSSVINVMVMNVNSVWVNITTIYLSNNGLNFYFTSSGLSGRPYKAVIMKQLPL